METLLKLTRRQVETLESVHALEGDRRGAALRDVARELRISPPSALAHLTQLESHGLVARYRGKTRLSPAGVETLVEYRRHHRVAEGLFSQLGLSPDAVCAAAREVDLAISHETVAEICAAEGHPETCPHGEPIGPCEHDHRSRTMTESEPLSRTPREPSHRTPTRHGSTRRTPA